jgi:hypothetical protein
MMHFDRVPRPRGWQTHVLAKGRQWLKTPGNRSKERPRDYWSNYRESLKHGFHELCGYTVHWAPVGTVDHFIPWNSVRGTRYAHQAYQWDNLRYALEWFNRDRGITDIPDPYTVLTDWFELLLPSLELVATSKVPANELTRVQSVLRWLGKHPNVINTREGYWSEYRTLSASGAPCIAFETLERRAPLLARALTKNPEFLHPADRKRLGL